MYYYHYIIWATILDEIRFWKVQEKEHTIVMRVLGRNMESQFAYELYKLENRFGEMEGKANKYIEALNKNWQYKRKLFAELYAFTIEAITQSQEFIDLVSEIIAKSRSSSMLTFRVVSNHIRNESNYLIGIVKGLLTNMF